MGDNLAAVPDIDYPAEFIEFIRRPETTLIEMVTWLVDRNLEVTFSIPEPEDPANPGNFYVNGRLAMTHEEWVAKA